jgi:hypothetical protein
MTLQSFYVWGVKRNTISNLEDVADPGAMDDEKEMARNRTFLFRQVPPHEK